MSSVGWLVGVGVGPGDPEDLTLKAIAAIKSADVVFAPCSAPDLEGRAESIVRRGLPDVAIKRLIFDMSSGLAGLEARRAGARIAAIALVESLNAGLNLAFITLGDPNVFSTFSLIATEVHRQNPDIEIRSVPGIMAFQEVAAISSMNLLDETEKLFLVTAHEGVEDVVESLAHLNAATVIYKGGRQLDQIRGALEAANRLEGSVIGELLGLEGERVEMLDCVTEPAVSYLATIIVPPVREPTGEDTISCLKEGNS